MPACLLRPRFPFFFPFVQNQQQAAKPSPAHRRNPFLLAIQSVREVGEREGLRDRSVGLGSSFLSSPSAVERRTLCSVSLNRSSLSRLAHPVDDRHIGTSANAERSLIRHRPCLSCLQQSLFPLAILLALSVQSLLFCYLFFSFSKM